MTPDLSAFGVVQLQRPLAGGHRNAVWLVETPHGPAVAKSTRHAAEGLHWLGPLQQAARAAGFVVPEFHRTGAGQILSNGWTLEDWLPGPAFTPADMPAMLPRVLAFHAKAPALPQRPGAVALPQASLADLPPDIATLCRAALRPFADQPAQPIHGDITQSNLIHTAHGPALIDWDEARCDLAFLDLIQLGTANPTERRAHLAAEIISGWTLEPEYAQVCASRLAHL
jgi:Phosphotransferase enzyme family